RGLRAAWRRSRARSTARERPTARRRRSRDPAHRAGRGPARPGPTARRAAPPRQPGGDRRADASRADDLHAVEHLAPVPSWIPGRPQCTPWAILVRVRVQVGDVRLYVDVDGAKFVPD